MKKADVFYRETKVGQLVEDENGYSFCYDEDYLLSGNAEPISLTLPLTSKPYQSSTMFPFFDGLIPEGWLLDVALRNTDVSILDRMSLLLLCCKDCIGAVSVVPEKEEVSHV